MKTKLSNTPATPSSTSNLTPQSLSPASRDSPIGLQDEKMKSKKRRGEESSTKQPMKTFGLNPQKNLVNDIFPPINKLTKPRVDILIPIGQGINPPINVF